VFQLIGSFGVILKLIFVFVAKMILLEMSKVTPLKVFGVDADNVVLPVMYTLLPSLADTITMSFIGAVEAGFLALFKVIEFWELADEG
jgi:hypothetical protein